MPFPVLQKLPLSDADCTSGREPHSVAASKSTTGIKQGNEW